MSKLQWGILGGLFVLALLAQLLGRDHANMAGTEMTRQMGEVADQTMQATSDMAPARASVTLAISGMT
jgi:hypothetical protein